MHMLLKHESIKKGFVNFFNIFPKYKKSKKYIKNKF